MNEHFNRLTPAEAERLSILAEECAEVIQAVCKIKRHGYDSYNPDAPKDGDNRMQLAREIGHVKFIIEHMLECDDVRTVDLRDSKIVKERSIRKYMHHRAANRSEAAS